MIHSIMYSYYAFTVLKLGIAKYIKVREGGAPLRPPPRKSNFKLFSLNAQSAVRCTCTPRYPQLSHPPPTIHTPESPR